MTVSCSNTLLPRRAANMKALSQRAIFEYLKTPCYLVGKGLTKIDPVLCQRDTVYMQKLISRIDPLHAGKRDTLSFRQETCFTEPMSSDDLVRPVGEMEYRIAIPTAMLSKYTYTNPGIDYGVDYAIIHQFSPLLITKTSGLYYMEHYLWGNSCGDEKEKESCIRGVQRKYLKFKIENDKIDFVEEVEPSNRTNFCGYGPIPVRMGEMQTTE